MPRVNNRRAVAVQATRRVIVETAARLFIDRGYHAATLGEIAREAGVAIQTIYNSIGSKRDVLSKVLDYAAAGEHAPTPAPTFVLAQAEQEPDTHKILDQLVDFWRESRPRTAPFYKLLRQAAAVDDEMAELERTPEQPGTYDALPGDRWGAMIGPMSQDAHGRSASRTRCPCRCDPMRPGQACSSGWPGWIRPRWWTPAPACGSCRPR